MNEPLNRKKIQFLKGIGPRRAEALERIGIATVEDLLFHFPRDYQDRTNRKTISQARAGERVTIAGAVMEVREKRPRSPRIRSIYEALLRDHTGDMILVWFNQPHLSRLILPGEFLVCHGKVSRYGRALQMNSPEFERVEQDEVEEGDGILPVYPLTEGVSQGALRKSAAFALDQDLAQLPEILPSEIVERQNLLTRREAVRILHRPPCEGTEEALARARGTIVFEEFFLLELALGLRRKLRTREVLERETIAPVRPDLRERYLRSLPFGLTAAQKRVMEEIGGELERPQAMERLLQGDVGCGKTVVLLWALLWAVERGLQGAVMVPTEILAEQHLRTLRALTAGLGVRIGSVTGSSRPAGKREARLWEGDPCVPDIVVGTHALFYDSMDFENLGVVVIDEQHKFGVLQRQKLLAKGRHPHLLITSATPIPRTLAMTVYGDLDVSVIDEMPPGRAKIVTRWTHWDRSEKVFDFIRQHLRAGRQAYVVCPLVEVSEKSPHLAAAEDRFPVYRDVIFRGFACGLIHGRMTGEEKEEAMRAFERGDLRTLVSTTVIEVGIDVPNASLILIENAERFGLSQLHQLRGRVGRGSNKSYCILLTDKSIGEVAGKRMKVMEETSDGFRVAEEDLGIRGPGELMGTKQSGVLPFRLANLIGDEAILLRARGEAFRFLDEHPRVEGEEFGPLREMLRRQQYLTA